MDKLEDCPLGGPDNLPTTISQQMVYELEDFSPVREETSDKETTIYDLAVLNNHLAMHSAVLPYVRTIGSLCALSASACKLIETRRKVKKLPFGDPSGKGSGRTFEVLE